MKRSIWRSFVLLTTLFSSLALACSYCKRDIDSDAEFDKDSWNEASVVFVATIISARLGPEAEEWGSLEVEYQYRIEEIYKGKSDGSLRLYSSRTLSSWSGEIGVISCGDIVIGPADRVLVFSDGASDVYFGRCSASRIVDLADDESRQTVGRIKAWRN